jgi:hypothetical protein
MPFVRLVVLKARPGPRLQETPLRVDRRISTAGSSAAPLRVDRRRQQAMSKRFESGGHEQGARSDDLKAHRTLLVPPPPRPGTGLEHARQTSKSIRDAATISRSLSLTTEISSPAKLREEYAASRHKPTRSAAYCPQRGRANGRSKTGQLAPEFLLNGKSFYLSQVFSPMLAMRVCGAEWCVPCWSGVDISLVWLLQGSFERR